MRNSRKLQFIQMLALGAVLLQADGCSPLVFNQYLQTLLLGVTAAGAVAILRNV